MKIIEGFVVFQHGTPWLELMTGWLLRRISQPMEVSFKMGPKSDVTRGQGHLKHMVTMNRINRIHHDFRKAL